MAVGNYTSSAGVIETLAERWNGTEWSIQTTPNPSENLLGEHLHWIHDLDGWCLVPQLQRVGGREGHLSAVEQEPAE
jgi:hypothetical protein